MREVLANMHQEELDLFLDNKKNWEVLIKERSTLFENLSNLKSARLETKEQLVDLLPFSKKNIPIEELLALDDEGYSEILLLQDQFSALLVRTNFQSQRNTYLQQTKHQLAINSYNPILKLYREKQKKKSSVITCEKYEN